MTIVHPVPSDITKTYPQRGPLQQFRFVRATAFSCFRCGNSKKAKLIAIYAGDWSNRLCNGCYGYLLSVYEIKAGTEEDNERADRLADTLLSILTSEDQRQAVRLFRAAEKRAEYLSQEAARFIATAEYVANQLQSDPQLEWSPAVIGLCKAVEIEVISRILLPLVEITQKEDLSADKDDKDLRRVAAFCMNPKGKPPELGAFAHFLQTVIHSQQRRETSSLIRSFLHLSSNWTGANWLLDPKLFYRELTTMTKSFRNRAAHVDELGKKDYIGCRELIIGAEGILWKLLLATEGHK